MKNRIILIIEIILFIGMIGLGIKEIFFDGGLISNLDKSNKIEKVTNKEISKDIKKLLLGKDFKGINIAELIDMENFKFLDEEISEKKEIKLLEKVQILDKGYIYIEHKNDIYKIKVNINNNKTEEIIYVSSIYGREGHNLGDYIEGYEDWIILHDNDTYVEAICKYTSDDELKLGNSYDIEDSVYSYNNAIDTINEFLRATTYNGKKLPKYKQIRSVGAQKDDTIRYFEYSNEHEICEHSSGKEIDFSFEKDVIKMNYLNILESDNKEDYWIASRWIIYDSDSIDRGIWNSSFFIDDWYDGLYYININNGNSTKNEITAKVRPIINIEI